MPLNVSVVVLTCAGLPPLRACLDALTHSEVPAHEVIVVDGSPRGDLRERLLPQHPGVRVVRNRDGPRARRRARLIGAASARTDVVAFLDDDAVPDRQWLGNLMRHYTDPEVLGVGGRLLSYRPTPGPTRSLPGRALANGRLVSHFRVDPGRPIRVHHLSGVNMSFRRDVLHDLDTGEFNGTAEWEDADLCWQVRATGGQLVFDPRAIVRYESGRPRVGGPRRPRPIRRHYTVRNNLAMLIRRSIPGLPAQFAWAVLRAHPGRAVGTVRMLSTGAQDGGVSATRRVAGELAALGGELSGVVLGLVDGFGARWALRRARSAP